jgi:hypothetical protein
LSVAKPVSLIYACAFLSDAGSTRMDSDMAVRSRLEKQPTDCGDASIISVTVHVKGRKPVRHGGQTGFLGHGGKSTP